MFLVPRIPPVGNPPTRFFCFSPAVEGLDFGAFKVVDEQRTSLEVVNRGKYEVRNKDDALP